MLYLARENGQGLVEYAFLIMFVAIVVVVILAAFGQELLEFYQLISDCLPEPDLAACLNS